MIEEKRGVVDAGRGGGEWRGRKEKRKKEKEKRKKHQSPVVCQVAAGFPGNLEESPMHGAEKEANHGVVQAAQTHAMLCSQLGGKTPNARSTPHDRGNGENKTGSNAEDE